ncbi:MAG: hypothetical protein HYX60_00140 [Legionella longbeachae]|nr:hypothetical protein [Legionella longbeachae]
METYEHKEAGDNIGIETRDNPYLPRTVEEKEQNLLKNANKFKVRMMQDLDGVPMPLNLWLSPGDIVALAGDYYTKAGWGLALKTPGPDCNPNEACEQLLSIPIEESETKAFQEAYADLANPSVKESDIKRIYYIEDHLPNLLQQVAYAWTVKDYGKKLINNEAHFDPWSLRAYMVGHKSALNAAELARACRILSGEKIQGNQSISQHVSDDLQKIKERIDKDRIKYGFSNKSTDTQIFEELANRYHAKAVAEELFIMHFYSDHFAGGHLSRIGMLRKSLPEQFGTWGSILINNMHNEDNTRSVEAINQYQAKIPGSTFQMIKELFNAYGDDSYNLSKNDRNANMLVNGMTASLSDIYQLIETGEQPTPENYGGMSFLASIDYGKRQTQPLLVQGPKGETWFRSDVKNIKILSSNEYQEMLKNPKDHGYEKLTTFKAFQLVIKLRLLSFYFNPEVEVLSEKRRNKIELDEESYRPKTVLKETSTETYQPKNNPSPEMLQKPTISENTKQDEPEAEKLETSAIKISI